MNCGRVQHRLTLFLLGDLDAAERGRIEEHLAACDVCRAHVQDLQTTLDLLGGALADARAEAGLSLSREARLKIMATRPGPLPSWSWVFERHPRLALAASVVAVAGITWGVVANLRPVRPSPPAGERVHAEQLENEAVDSRAADKLLAYKPDAKAAEEKSKRRNGEAAPYAAVPATQPVPAAKPADDAFADFAAAERGGDAADAKGHAEKRDLSQRVVVGGQVSAPGGMAGSPAAASAESLDLFVAVEDAPARPKAARNLRARESGGPPVATPGLHAVDRGAGKDGTLAAGTMDRSVADDSLRRRDADEGSGRRTRAVTENRAVLSDAPGAAAPVPPPAPRPAAPVATAPAPETVQSVEPVQPAVTAGREGAAKYSLGARAPAVRGDLVPSPSIGGAPARQEPVRLEAAEPVASSAPALAEPPASTSVADGEALRKAATAPAEGVSDLRASADAVGDAAAVPTDVAVARGSTVAAAVSRESRGYEAVRRSLAGQVWPPRDVVGEGLLQSVFQRGASEDRAVTATVARLEDLLRRGPFGSKVEELDTVADELESLAESRGNDPRLVDLARMARAAAALIRGE